MYAMIVVMLSFYVTCIEQNFEKAHIGVICGPSPGILVKYTEAFSGLFLLAKCQDVY